MKTNGKHTINRKPLSSEEIKRMQNFDAVLKGASDGIANGGGGKGGFGNGLYIAGGTLLIIAGLATWMLIPLNKEDAISRQVEQNIPETMPRTQEDSEDLVRAPLVRLPVNEGDIAYSRYALDATKGGIIKHPSGTRITLPASCLIDQNGKKVSGIVEFRYREFQDTENMAELRVFQGDQELKLEPGKKIQIEIIYPAKSTVDGQQTTEIEPVFLKITPKTTSIKLEQELQKLVNEKPKAPQKATISRPRFNLDLDLKDFPELEALGTMEFEVAPEDKIFTPEHYKIEWNDIQLKRHSDRRYKMVLTKDANGKIPLQQIELIVIPVIAEKDFESAKKRHEEQVREHDKKVVEKKQEIEALKMEEKVTIESPATYRRSIIIDRFGMVGR